MTEIDILIKIKTLDKRLYEELKIDDIKWLRDDFN